MKFSPFNHKLTGVVIPLFSLRSNNSCGIGEFSDLPYFGQWCKKNNLEIIQILPINDTGDQSSPYSALSAFALHPIFMGISDLKESVSFAKEIAMLKKDLESSKKLQFGNVYKKKMNVLEQVFKYNQKNIVSDKTIDEWVTKNEWVKNYSIFSFLKKKNSLKSWKYWQEYSNPTVEDLDLIWNLNRSELYFYIWLQYNLEYQLKKALKSLNEMGIALKGDIPILMNEDSCDVWSNRNFFKLDLVAGAPPDMFSQKGQNWGFPVYNWSSLKKANFVWWRKRLKQAEKFYNAYRIDHVLGFFRIWNISEKMTTGRLGYFCPQSLIHQSELYKLDFNDGRIKWLSKAHIREDQLIDLFGDSSSSIVDLFFDRIGSESLFIFKEEFNSEKKILDSSFSQNIKEKLCDLLCDICFIEVNKDTFAFNWYFRSSQSFLSLSELEKDRLEKLHILKSSESELLWTQNATILLSMMKQSNNMLVCAEDLGVIPACVPKVLNDLEIYSLKVHRWTREWKMEGQPYIPVEEHPQLSVCTPAVHDSTTVKQWFIEEKNLQPTTDEIEKYYDELANTNSSILMFQIQDLFALHINSNDENLEVERINIPGTISEKNWSYRIPMTIEKLLNNNELNKKIQNITSKRYRTEL